MSWQAILQAVLSAKQAMDASKKGNNNQNTPDFASLRDNRKNAISKNDNGWQTSGKFVGGLMGGGTVGSSLKNIYDSRQQNNLNSNYSADNGQSNNSMLSYLIDMWSKKRK